MQTWAVGLPQTGWRTRFAPAPTGYLHLGHLVNAIHVWGLARAYGGSVALRVEDHDATRCRPEFELAILEDLEWLGFEPDAGSLHSFGERFAQRSSDTIGPHHRVPHRFRQSDNDARYASALDRLAHRGVVYPCICTRRDIAERVGHAAGEDLRYDGTCRAGPHSISDTLARRILLDDGIEAFTDLRCGAQQQQPSLQCGDVLARDRHGCWTYQFAVVVDDMHHGIDVVIRGEDLLCSTGRQIRIARLLGRTVPPTFLHHGLLTRPDGSKLSKATNDTALRERKRLGASPARLLGEAAHAAGLLPRYASLNVADLPSLFITR